MLSIAAVLLFTASINAADRFSPDPEQISLATTGRIVKLDLKNRTLRVRGTEAQAVAAASRPIQNSSLWQRLGLNLPRGIRIDLPGLNGKRPSKPASNAENNLDDYTVIVTDDTLIRDGAEPIRLEDFKVGETISIHGVLRGNTLTASRIAKWS
jgi:hypothetical protein